VVNPTYIPLAGTGYVMDFNTVWQTSPCTIAPYTEDIPGNGWSSNDPYGFTSWRANNTPGSPQPWGTSGWPSVNTGSYGNPTSSIPYGVNFGSTNRSARVHTSHLSFDTLRTANLDLYMDMSTITGD